MTPGVMTTPTACYDCIRFSERGECVLMKVRVYRGFGFSKHEKNDWQK